MGNCISDLKKQQCCGCGCCKCCNDCGDFYYCGGGNKDEPKQEIPIPELPEYLGNLILRCFTLSSIVQNRDFFIQYCLTLKNRIQP